MAALLWHASARSVAARENTESTHTGVQVSPACQRHVTDFLATDAAQPEEGEHGSDAGAAVFEACARDAMSACEWSNLAYQDPPGRFPRHVLACLREHKDGMSPPCQAQLLAQQLAALADVRGDSPLYAACKGDAALLCSSRQRGSATELDCLQQHSQQVLIGPLQWCSM